MKQLGTLLVLLLVYASAQGQILKTTNLNLNAGGVIHDVAFDEYYNAYVVVGNFTSINGQARNNLAFIDATTYAVMSQAPIFDVNGEIRSVEVINMIDHTNVTLGSGHRNYIYLGGNFTIINGQSLTYLARLGATHYYGSPPVGGLANYAINTAWNPQLTDFATQAEAGIHDLLISGDTLIATGAFTNPSASYITGQEDIDVIALNASTIAFIRFPMFAVNTSNLFVFSVLEAIHGVRKSGNRYYLFGRDSNPTVHEVINEYDQNGGFIQAFSNCGSTQSVFDLEPHSTTNGQLFFSYEGVTFGSFNKFIASYNPNGTSWNCPGVSSSNTILNFPAMVGPNYIETYKEYIFNTDQAKLYASKRNGTANVPIATTINLNATWFNGYPTINAAPCLKRIDNRLFLSSNNLTTVGGSARTGFAVFCLEPQDAKPFTVSTPMVCEGEQQIYMIPQVQYATGYRWTYTGTGALYRIAGSGSAFAPLSTTFLSSTNANALEISFPAGSTAGTLSVEPFSTCNTTTDYQFSQGQSIAIAVNPLPNVILAPTYTLTCYSDTVHVQAQSNMPNVVYQWNFSGQPSINSSSFLITPTNGNGFDSTFYTVTVTNQSTLCSNTAMTYFTFDTIPLPINTSSITTNPAVFNCQTSSMSINSNMVGATLTWTSPSEAGIFPDPYVITLPTLPSGDLTLYATYVSNGCTAQASWGGIVVDMTPAVGTLSGFTYTGGGTAIDTLNCLNPTLGVECMVSAPFASNSSAQWLDNSVPTGSSLLNVSESDAQGADFVIYEFMTTNNDNGCTLLYNVQVAFDFEQPTFTPLADASLNCSQSSVQLTHPINGNSWINEGWLDGSGAQTGSDVLVATTIGDYYYHLQDTTNGCTNVDTVWVNQTMELYLDMVADTLICPDQVVSISPTLIGNTETPTYLWSTGSTNSNENATGGLDTQLSVIVSTPSGCVGYDTTTILITPPVVATITPIAGCTDGNLQVTNIVGGAGNFQYSLDGSPWQSATVFSGLSFGDYTIAVQDALGCVYSFDQTLDGSAVSIEMDFVVSTYNEQGDTIVLVNITDFAALDSVAWQLPLGANVLIQNDSIAILSIASGGWYDCSLVGYLDSTCVFTFTKPVYFGSEKPTFLTNYTSKGIQSFIVSPNPTSGLFDVSLEFGEAQNYSIVVTNSLGQPMAGMAVSAQGILATHSFAFDAATPAGAYRIHVIADYDAQQKNLILN